MKNSEFAHQAEIGVPNLGGIPVILSSEDKIKIDCYQAPKQYKYFRVEKE